MLDRSPSVLTVKGLYTWIAGDEGIIRVLDDIGFTLRPGQCVVLLGESGSGKSLTALSLMRLLPGSADIVCGSVESDGTEWLSLSERQFNSLRGRKVAMIFQEPSLALDPIMTVGDQIEEVLKIHTDLSPTERRERAVTLLKRVGIREAEKRIDDFPFSLSGGMKQRVMIASALAAEPDILIADEPTTALDVTVQAQVLALLKELAAERNMALLLITHDLGVASAMADQVVVMYAGEIVEVANSEHFFKAPAHPYTRKLFAATPGLALRGYQLPADGGSQPVWKSERTFCSFQSRCDYAIALCQQEHPLLRSVPGCQVRCLRYESLPPLKQNFSSAASDVGTRENILDKDPILTVENLKVFFPIRRGIFRRIVGYTKAVDGVNLALSPGKTTVLVGESGSGKTTVGRAIIRLVTPTEGDISLQGQSIETFNAHQLRHFRHQVQIIFQDPFASLNPRMRIREILKEGVEAIGMPVESIDWNALMASVGLDPATLDRYPHEFSGGQRQRIAIARAMAVDPAIIVCDEPTSALDMSVQAQVLNLLKNLQREKQLAYLFITHNWSVVEYLADDIAVMYLGRIVEAGPALLLLKAPAHPYTRRLIASVLPVGGSGLENHQSISDDLRVDQIENGCPFAPRCERREPCCLVDEPAERLLADGRTIRCHFPYSKDSLNG